MLFYIYIIELTIVCLSGILELIRLSVGAKSTDIVKDSLFRTPLELGFMLQEFSVERSHEKDQVPTFRETGIYEDQIRTELKYSSIKKGRFKFWRELHVSVQ